MPRAIWRVSLVQLLLSTRTEVAQRNKRLAVHAEATVFMFSPMLSPTDTYSAREFKIGGSNFWDCESLSLPGTSKTLSLHSTWWGSKALGSCSSLTSGSCYLWRSKLELGIWALWRGVGLSREIKVTGPSSMGPEELTVSPGHGNSSGEKDHNSFQSSKIYSSCWKVPGEKQSSKQDIQNQTCHIPCLPCMVKPQALQFMFGVWVAFPCEVPTCSATTVSYPPQLPQEWQFYLRLQSLLLFTISVFRIFFQ